MIRLKVNSLSNCIQDKRPQWFGHLERIDGQVNVKPSRSMTITPKDNLRKQVLSL